MIIVIDNKRKNVIIILTIDFCYKEIKEINKVK